MRVRLAAILAVFILAAGLAVSTAQPAEAGNSLKRYSLGNSLVATPAVQAALLVMPLALPDADSSRLYHRTDSKVSSIRACKDAASSSRCATGSPTTYLSRGEYTGKSAAGWDGYWCPTGRTCRTYTGPVYTTHGPISSGPRFVKVSGCAGCTKGIRVM